jgi:hypothetical protein
MADENSKAHETNLPDFNSGISYIARINKSGTESPASAGIKRPEDIILGYVRSSVIVNG